MKPPAVKPLPRNVERLLVVACVLALCSIPLMMWSLLQPNPVPIILAMSIGQALGILSLLFFVIAVLRDLHRSRVLGRRASPTSEPAAAPLPPT